MREPFHVPIIERVTVASGQRSCPHCSAALALDLARKCPKCKKPLAAYCFACYAALPSDDVRTCPSCGQVRWVFGDHAGLACATENGTVRQHRWMATVVKGGKVLHEWRCMKCLADETRTDAFSHFPAAAAG